MSLFEWIVASQIFAQREANRRQEEQRQRSGKPNSNPYTGPNGGRDFISPLTRSCYDSTRCPQSCLGCPRMQRSLFALWLLGDEK